MRKSFLIIAMFLASVCGTQVYGQSLKNLFSKDNLKKAADAVVEQLDVTPKNVAGQWEYDGTFTTNHGKIKLPGKYTFSKENKTLELDYGMNEKFKGVALHTQVSVTTSGMELLFSADKLLDFVSKLTSSVGDSKLGELNNLVKEIDGLKIGFKLTRSAK